MGERRCFLRHCLLLLVGFALLGGLELLVGSKARAGQVEAHPFAGEKKPAGATQTTTLTPTDTPSGTATPSVLVTATPTRTPLPTRTPSPTPTSCPIQFSDVPPANPFYSYVQCLACGGIISGYPDGTFRPNADITRGQLSKIATLAAQFNNPIPPDRQTFEDVPIGSTFWWYGEEMYSVGIMSGYPCGGNPNEPCIPPNNRPYFRPGTPATRAQTAKVVDEAAGFASPCIGQAFEDVPYFYNDPFYCHIQRLHDYFAVSGYPCGGPGEPCVPPNNRPYFRRGNISTRGQLAKMTSIAMFPGCTTPAMGQRK
jgi:hypothetical protein